MVQPVATGFMVQGLNPPIPAADRSKTRLYGRSIAGVAGSNPAGGMVVCVVCVVQ